MKSDISTEQYHQLSDTTMDTLLESLETLLDDLGNPDYEVEYSVSLSHADRFDLLISFCDRVAY